MTDSVKGVTVAFERDLREDDAQEIIDAIRMIKGVHSAVPVSEKADDYIIRERVLTEVRRKIRELDDSIG